MYKVSLRTARATQRTPVLGRGEEDCGCIKFKVPASLNGYSKDLLRRLLKQEHLPVFRNEKN